MYWICMAKFWYQGGYRCGFWEKMLEAAPTSNGAKTIGSGDRSAAGQGQAHHQLGQHLWDDVPQERGKGAAQQQRQPETGGRTWERNSCADTQVSEGG